MYPALYLFSLRAAELEQNKLQEIANKRTGQNYHHREVIIDVNSHINCFRSKHYETYEFDSVTYLSIQLSYSMHISTEQIINIKRTIKHYRLHFCIVQNHLKIKCL